MIRLLPNPNFLAWLLKAIKGARRELLLVNYLATLEQGGKGPVTRVAAALAAAARRKVRVQVVLEGSKFRENMAFYRALREAGASVWMDTSLTFIHTKAALIDGRVLCAGSHNLTASALTSHHELSMAANDRGAVRRFLQEFKRMTAQQQRIKAEVCREGTILPLSTIVPLTVLKRAISPQAHLLYLLLCRIDAGKPRPVRIDAAAWARELGLPESTAPASVRIAAMLRFMDCRAKVVKFDETGQFVVRLSPHLPLPSSPYKGEEKRGFLIPATFWKYGWHRRLSVAAIHLYLAGQAERQQSPFAPWWRLTRDEIATRYGFQKQLVNRAQEELRRAGLLEVIFETGKVQDGRYARYRNYFRQNPFYDAAARERQLARMTSRFPARTVHLARCIAAHLCEEADPQKLEALCSLVARAGLSAAGLVSRRIARLAPNSTRRTFEFAEELLSANSSQE